MKTPLTLYGIPNCDTVKRARVWLAAQRYEVQFHDFKTQGVPEAELQRWIAALGWEPLVNRQGTTWRKLSDAERAAVCDAASATTLMLAVPSVIKRPVIRWGDTGPWTVGFKDGFAPPR